MQFFARLESDGLSGRDIYFSPGPWVTADAGLARTDIKDTKAAQLDAVSLGEGLLQAFKDLVNSRLSFVTGQASAFNHVMDDVLFYQCLHPCS